MGLATVETVKRGPAALGPLGDGCSKQILCLMRRRAGRQPRPPSGLEASGQCARHNGWHRLTVHQTSLQGPE